MLLIGGGPFAFFILVGCLDLFFAFLLLYCLPFCFKIHFSLHFIIIILFMLFISYFQSLLMLH